MSGAPPIRSTLTDYDLADGRIAVEQMHEAVHRFASCAASPPDQAGGSERHETCELRPG
jgi:hypothetical protein